MPRKEFYRERGREGCVVLWVFMFIRKGIGGYWRENGFWREID